MFLKLLAKAGDKASAGRIGDYYAFSLQDQKTAEKWYQMAGEKNSSE
jgi:hypothetical protein